jgi:SAM-dependent methyltransferase
MICAAADTVVLPQASFDNIVLFGLLEHCPDAGVALDNLRSSLTPEGRMHILVNNAGSIHRWLGVELGMIRSVEDVSESDIRFGHYRVYTPETLRGDIERAGLRIEFMDLHYMKPLPTPAFNHLPMELHRAFVQLGRRFPEFSSYIYVEAMAGKW